MELWVFFEMGDLGDLGDCGDLVVVFPQARISGDF